MISARGGEAVYRHVASTCAASPRSTVGTLRLRLEPTCKLALLLLLLGDPSPRARARSHTHTQHVPRAAGAEGAAMRQHATPSPEERLRDDISASCTFLYKTRQTVNFGEN